MQPDDPQLLLVAADDHTPALARGASIARAARHPTSAAARPEMLWSEAEHPDDLAAQRWAVFAPEGDEGDLLLAALAPLIARRGEQQGAPARVYRVPPDLDAAAAARWKKQVFWPSERLLQHLPRYHLFLGDLHQISHDTTTIFASDGFTGRLAFDRAADYEAYVDKLIAAERATPSAVPRAIFHTVRDGTGATSLGHAGLMTPGLALTQSALPTASLVPSGADLPAPGPLLQLARAPQPTVLLSLSHGEGAPRGGWRSPADQRARQGAMSFGREGRIAADDVASAAFLPHGLWFMFACFSAGTPRTSKYRAWLDELAALGQYPGDPAAVLASLPPPGAPPFVAALPKAALANPRGPLAFIGHVDLAWTYSFRDLDAGPMNRASRFVQALTSLLRGHRVGAAFRELFRFFEQTNTELTTLDDSSTRDAARRAHLWMLRQDLAGFVVLGDPAARLPLRDGAPPPLASDPPPAPVDVRGASGPRPAARGLSGPQPAARARSGPQPAASPDPAAFFPGVQLASPAPPARSGPSDTSSARPGPSDTPPARPGPSDTSSARPAASDASRPSPAAGAAAHAVTDPVAFFSSSGPDTPPAPLRPADPRPRGPDPAAFFAGMTVLPPAAPAPAPAPPIERLERAIAQVLLDERALAGAAQQLGLAPAALADLVARYRRAGRAAVET